MVVLVEPKEVVERRVDWVVRSEMAVEPLEVSMVEAAMAMAGLWVDEKAVVVMAA